MLIGAYEYVPVSANMIVYECVYALLGTNYGVCLYVLICPFWRYATINNTVQSYCLRSVCFFVNYKMTAKATKLITDHYRISKAVDKKGMFLLNKPCC